MRAAFVRIVLVAALGASVTALAEPRSAASATVTAPTFERTERCDLPQAREVAKAQNVPDVLACEAACAAIAACRSYVFISGWNRCLFKGEAGKKVSVRFYSGAVTGGKVIDAAYDRDYSGKDLRRVTRVRSGELCGAECEKEPKCVAFAHIGGYDDCWLKHTVGTQRGKIFSCGARADTGR